MLTTPALAFNATGFLGTPTAKTPSNSETLFPKYASGISPPERISVKFQDAVLEKTYTAP